MYTRVSLLSQRMSHLHSLGLTNDVATAINAIHQVTDAFIGETFGSLDDIDLGGMFVFVFERVCTVTSLGCFLKYSVFYVIPLFDRLCTVRYAFVWQILYCTLCFCLADFVH